MSIFEKKAINLTLENLSCAVKLCTRANGINRKTIEGLVQSELDSIYGKNAIDRHSLLVEHVKHFFKNKPEWAQCIQAIHVARQPDEDGLYVLLIASDEECKSLYDNSPNSNLILLKLQNLKFKWSQLRDEDVILEYCPQERWHDKLFGMSWEIVC